MDINENTQNEEISLEAYKSALDIVLRFQNQIQERDAEITAGNHLEKHIVDLYFSERIKSVFLNLNIHQVKDLMKYRLSYFESLKNFGSTSRKELVETLSRFGLKLNP